MGADLTPDERIRLELEKANAGSEPDWRSRATASGATSARDGDIGSENPTWSQAGFATVLQRLIRSMPAEGVGKSNPYVDPTQGQVKAKDPLAGVRRLQDKLLAGVTLQGDADYQAALTESMSPTALAANLAELSGEALELMSDHWFATLVMAAIRAAMQYGANRAAQKGSMVPQAALAAGDMALLLGPLGPGIRKWREAVQLAATTKNTVQAANAMKDAQRNYALVVASAGATLARWGLMRRSAQSRANPARPPIIINPGTAQAEVPTVAGAAVPAHQVAPWMPDLPPILKELGRFLSPSVPALSLAGDAVGADATSSLGFSVFFSESQSDSVSNRPTVQPLASGQSGNNPRPAVQKAPSPSAQPRVLHRTAAGTTEVTVYEELSRANDGVPRSATLYHSGSHERLGEATVVSISPHGVVMRFFAKPGYEGVIAMTYRALCNDVHLWNKPVTVYMAPYSPTFSADMATYLKRPFFDEGKLVVDLAQYLQDGGTNRQDINQAAQHALQQTDVYRELASVGLEMNDYRSGLPKEYERRGMYGNYPVLQMEPKLKPKPAPAAPTNSAIGPAYVSELTSKLPVAGWFEQVKGLWPSWSEKNPEQRRIAFREVIHSWTKELGCPDIEIVYGHPVGFRYHRWDAAIGSDTFARRGNDLVFEIVCEHLGLIGAQTLQAWEMVRRLVAEGETVSALEASGYPPGVIKAAMQTGANDLAMSVEATGAILASMQGRNLQQAEKVREEKNAALWR